MKHSRRTPEQMFPVIESYLSSGLTQKAFCSELGLAVSVFGYWLRRYRRETASRGGFVEIAPNSGSADRALVELAYPSGVRLRFFSPVEPSVLERLVHGAR